MGSENHHHHKRFHIIHYINKNNLFSCCALQLQDSQAKHPQLRYRWEKEKAWIFLLLGTTDLPWIQRMVCFTGMRATPTITSSRPPASAVFTESGRCCPAPAQCAPALSAPDISPAHIRAAAAQGCAWDWQQLPHPPKSHSQQRRVEKVWKGSIPKGRYQFLPRVLRNPVMSREEETQIMVAYRGWAGDNKADASEWKYVKNLHTWRTAWSSFCPTAGPTRTTLMGLKPGTPWVSDWKSKMQQKFIKSQNDLGWKGS